MKRILSIAVLIVLAGCSLTMPRDIGNDHKLELVALDGPAARKGTGQGTLIVNRPTVRSELDTYRIALMGSDGTADYYAGMRWSDFLPVIVQQTVVRSLQQSGRYRSVASDEERTNGSEVLQLEIDAFEAMYAAYGGPPVWHIRLRATWENGSGAQRGKQAVIESNVAAQGKDREALAEAIRTAYAEALTKLIASRPR